MKRKKTLSVGNRAYAVIVVLLMFASACNKAKPNWYAEPRSQEGAMLVTATTWKQGGFGTDTNQTVVRLNWTTGSQKPTVVLIFDDKVDGTVDTKVGMKWLNPHRLALSYSGDRYVNFFATRCDGVNITLERN